MSWQTHPLTRHKLIQEFQATSSATVSKLFLATYDVAAVGVTLTAASRVYLLDCSLDPAQEAQAAGRIHRLGQSKEVLIKR